MLFKGIFSKFGRKNVLSSQLIERIKSLVISNPISAKEEIYKLIADKNCSCEQAIFLARAMLPACKKLENYDGLTSLVYSLFDFINESQTFLNLREERGKDELKGLISPTTCVELIKFVSELHEKFSWSLPSTMKLSVLNEILLHAFPTNLSEASFNLARFGLSICEDICVGNISVIKCEVYDRLIELFSIILHHEEELPFSITRRLKQVEICIRLDLHHIVNSLSTISQDILSLIRSVEFVDIPALRHSVCSFQLRNILRREFNVDVNPVMIGPYATRIADTENKIIWNVLDDYQEHEEAMRSLRLRHFDSLGWQVHSFDNGEWIRLSTYEAKLEHVRKDLLNHKLLDVLRTT